MGSLFVHGVSADYPAANHALFDDGRRTTGADETIAAGYEGRKDFISDRNDTVRQPIGPIRDGVDWDVDVGESHP